MATRRGPNRLNGGTFRPEPAADCEPGALPAELAAQGGTTHFIGRSGGFQVVSLPMKRAIAAILASKCGWNGRRDADRKRSGTRASRIGGLGDLTFVEDGRRWLSPDGTPRGGQPTPLGGPVRGSGRHRSRPARCRGDRERPGAATQPGRDGRLDRAEI